MKDDSIYCAEDYSLRREHTPLYYNTHVVFPTINQPFPSKTIRLTMVNTAFSQSSLSAEDSYEAQTPHSVARRATRSRTHSDGTLPGTSSRSWDINVRRTRSVRFTSDEEQHDAGVTSRWAAAATSGVARLNEMLAGARISFSPPHAQPLPFISLLLSHTHALLRMWGKKGRYDDMTRTGTRTFADL